MTKVLDFRFILILFLCICMFFLYREIENLNKKTANIEKKINSIVEFQPSHATIEEINYNILENLENALNSNQQNNINYDTFIDEPNNINKEYVEPNEQQNKLKVEPNEEHVEPNELKVEPNELKVEPNEEHTQDSIIQSENNIQFVNGNVESTNDDNEPIQFNTQPSNKNTKVENENSEDELTELSDIEINLDSQINNIIEDSDNDTIEEFSNECSDNINIYSNDNEEDDHSSVLESYLENTEVSIDDLLKNKLIELQDMAKELDISLVNDLGKRKTKLLLAQDIISKKNI